MIDKINRLQKVRELLAQANTILLQDCLDAGVESLEEELFKVRKNIGDYCDYLIKIR